ncbi:FkbM family methyltransferase [Antarcticibacterium flavum]|uniref:FkbM family methyltransferase n=1 Tax=Antarcticibacterium flavum TaxID=2058175 RepID=A0A5B7X659_9FLAO|nr:MULTISPECIES: FkbM family methyltransferase [Antarcticibacterium]MCM4161412.1 SAM-dependent methyltransferase [Antarcticibacterium sp. W02-3]QCY70565.1 FkbM family methyltransferase [Antarcticibacterium flavum]
MTFTSGNLGKSIKKRIKKFLFRLQPYSHLFSQGGEDAILYGIFYKKIKKGTTGFFVDVGAYHPFIHSNTYLFYLKGWRGINIDANPGSMKEFKKKRPRDINLELGISDKNGYSTFYVLHEDSTMNTFSAANLQEHNMLQAVEKKKKIETRTLESVLDEYSEEFTEIDLFSIDVEGFDQVVLESNNWSKYRPKVIVVEMNCSDIHDVMKHEISLFLYKKEYKIVAKNLIRKDLASVFFVSNDFDY